MIRSIVFLVCVVCVATVLTEILGLAYLWFNGQLNPNSLHDIRVALGGVEMDVEDQESSEDTGMPSLDDVIKERSLRVWSLQERASELNMLKAMVTEKADGLTASREAFEKERQQFLKQLNTISANLVNESAEQTRGILLKMAPEDAVTTLMKLSLDENVVILKGMQDKTVATILQQFLASGDPKQVERGQKIFEAISKGQPSRKVINQALGQPAGQ
ncbi:MAG: hypothetical protein Tsb009_02370 [Planctomycetaceae bacterium]